MAPHPHSAVNNRRVADLVAGRDPFAHGPPPLAPMSRPAVPALGPGRDLRAAPCRARPARSARTTWAGTTSAPSSSAGSRRLTTSTGERLPRRRRGPGPLPLPSPRATWRHRRLAGGPGGGRGRAAWSSPSCRCAADRRSPGWSWPSAWVGGAVALAFWPIAGRTGEQWLPVVVRWGWAGATGHRFAAASGPGTGARGRRRRRHGRRSGAGGVAPAAGPTPHSVFDGLRLAVRAGRRDPGRGWACSSTSGPGR